MTQISAHEEESRILARMRSSVGAEWEQHYNAAAREILKESHNARIKFPAFNSSHEGYAVIAEELDELWDDVKANNVEHAIAEAVQVGAMALRFIADMRAKYNLDC